MARSDRNVVPAHGAHAAIMAVIAATTVPGTAALMTGIAKQSLSLRKPIYTG
jgi:hypothetical protein